MKPYVRRAYYYETDQMSIVHHANYIRWMEEARMDYMRQTGLPYGEMEKSGIIMPVTGVSCEYKHSVLFDDEVKIYTKLVFFNGVRATYRYEIRMDGCEEPAVTGESSHCFLDEKTRLPISLRRQYPSFYQKGLELIKEEA